MIDLQFLHVFDRGREEVTPQFLSKDSSLTCQQKDYDLQILQMAAQLVNPTVLWLGGSRCKCIIYLVLCLFAIRGTQYAKPSLREQKGIRKKNLRRKRKGAYLVVEVQAKALKETEVLIATEMRSAIENTTSVVSQKIICGESFV